MIKLVNGVEAPLTAEEAAEFAAIDAIAIQWELVRVRRNGLLDACDWTRLDDNGLTEAQRAEWATYRQALRDITTQGDPVNITWPVAP